MGTATRKKLDSQAPEALAAHQAAGEGAVRRSGAACRGRCGGGPALPRQEGYPFWSERPERVRGFNFFSTDDDIVLSAILRGEFTISGLRNKDLRSLLHDKKPGWTSRCLKRLRVHGLVKRIGKTYKYHVTELGRRVVLTGLELREMVIIPALAQSSKAVATG